MGALQTLTRAQLEAALAAVGVHHGDGLLVHSALQLLGRPEGGLQMILDALRQAVGAKGTIAVPTFAFVFHLGQDFDAAKSPSKDMGAFSEFVRQQPESLRTRHPMQSLSVLGAHAADLAQRDTLSAFDPGSAFERMLELEFKLLLLGADVQAASIVHYSEQRAGVPYRYWKDFTGRVKLDQQWETRTYRMFVRDLDIDPQLKLAPIQAALEAKGQWRSHSVNYGQVAVCTLLDFVATTDALLAADPWALVANKPERAVKR
jgi:aminoglycoside N3'-acetyltransferase